ncbi:MAG TPA: methyltransferase domain-containing protein [Candidatus Binataceae bacterium]|nr:methyltransferase domain-containing protein [Candidatus Binataceae bacterium]
MSEQAVDPQRLKDDQRRDWDAAAAGWRKWWAVFERAAQHVSDRLIELAAIAPGARVLDIATGNGEPAVTAARLVGPRGRVIATDQSGGMLAIARERASALGVTNIEFRESDAESLTIEDRGFDAVVCRWGLMFMPDIGRALRGLYDRLVPGGRLATAVWSTADKVPMITIGNDVVRKLAGLPPPVPGALEPLRLADPSILTGALEQAGYKDITIERLGVTFEFDSATAFTQFRADVSAPFRALLGRQTPEMRQRILDAVMEAAQTYAGADGKVRTTNETILFAARR